MPRKLAVLVVSLLTSVGCHTSRGQLINLPAVVIWAWERPEDLRFVNPRETGVAFLAATIRILGNGWLQVHSRTNPLQLPANAPVEAVVRIEPQRQHAAADPLAIAAALEHVALLPGVRALQIDFDARSSERALYRGILADLRKRVSIPVSLTALASWCSGDRWLEREPVAEAIPMLFRMGHDQARDLELRSPVCQSAIGLATDESWPVRRPPSIGRVYLFSPHAWTQANYAKALQRLEQWQ